MVVNIQIRVVFNVKLVIETRYETKTKEIKDGYCDGTGKVSKFTEFFCEICSSMNLTY